MVATFRISRPVEPRAWATAYLSFLSWVPECGWHPFDV